VRADELDQWPTDRWLTEAAGDLAKSDNAFNESSLWGELNERAADGWSPKEATGWLAKLNLTFDISMRRGELDKEGTVVDTVLSERRLTKAYPACEGVAERAGEARNR